MTLMICYNFPKKKQYENFIPTQSNSVGEERRISSSNPSMTMQENGAKQAIDKMKYEIANEFGVNLGPDSTSRANGSVGGEITRRLVQNGLNQVSGSYSNK